MRINKLKIENMFAYYGCNELDFSDTSKSKPIVVIMGRNGYGKTSLLKSLWLLFLGPEHRLLREIGYRKHSLGPRQVILGTCDDIYQGALNTRARRDRRSNTRYGISATIVLEEDDTEAVIERYWTLNGNQSDEGRLKVYLAEELLEESEAEAFIASVLAHK